MRSKISIFLLLIFLLLTGCKEQTFTITFDTLGGSLLESITLKKGETLNEVKLPEKDGYLFVNWLKDGVEYNLSNPITEDITLTANWVEKPEIFEYYSVTFINEDETEKTTVKKNEKVNEPKIKAKENYNFLGWFIGETKFDFNSPITKDIILTAKYELNVVTISYDLNGGLGLTLETIPKNSKISIPEPPIRPGYKFLKWTLNDQEFSFDTKITKDITLKAEWEKISYITITYDTDGGNIIKETTIEKYSKVNELPIPIKEGYEFIEWQLDGISFDKDTTLEENIILKATYKEKTE